MLMSSSTEEGFIILYSHLTECEVISVMFDFSMMFLNSLHFIDLLHFASCSDGQVVTMDRLTGKAI